MIALRTHSLLPVLLGQLSCLPQEAYCDALDGSRLDLLRLDLLLPWERQQAAVLRCRLQSSSVCEISISNSLGPFGNHLISFSFKIWIVLESECVLQSSQVGNLIPST